MKLPIAFLLLFTLLALPVSAQQQSQSISKKTAFVKEAISRFGADASSEDRRLLESKLATWEQSRQEKDWIALTDAIHKVAESAKSQCDVEISSSKGNGATIKYQTLGSRKRGEVPTTAKDLTKLSEGLFIGAYHIWSERAGQPTSDRDAQFEIIKEKEKVKLEEIR